MHQVYALLPDPLALPRLDNAPKRVHQLLRAAGFVGLLTRHPLLSLAWMAGVTPKNFAQPAPRLGAANAHPTRFPPLLLATPSSPHLKSLLTRAPSSATSTISEQQRGSRPHHTPQLVCATLHLVHA